MKLIWHIAWKDLRRLRLLIALWALLIAAKLGVGVMLTRGFGGGTFDQLASFDQLAFASYALAGVEVVAGYLIAAALIHGDVIVGTTSFWMTRPISSGRLLAGKMAAGAVVFGAIPLGLHLAWWILCSYGAKEVLLAAVEVLSLQSVVALIALSLATLTDGISRFLFWTLILVTAVIMVGATFSTALDGGVMAVSLVVLGAIMVATILHGAKGRLSISTTIGGGSAILGVVIAAFWSGAGVDAPTPSNQPTGKAAQDLELSFWTARAFERPDRETELHVGTVIKGVSPEMVLRGVASHCWLWPGGLVLARKSSLILSNNTASWLALGLPLPKEDAAVTVAREQFYQERGMLPGVDMATVAGSEVRVPAPFGGRVRQEPPVYSLRADLRLMRPVVLGERPAQPREAIIHGAEVTRVLKFTGVRNYKTKDGKWRSERFEGSSAPAVSEESWNYVEAVLAEYMPTLPNMVARSVGIGPFVLSSWPARAYFLINRARGNLAEDHASSFRDYDTRRTKTVRIGTVGIVWRMAHWRAPNVFSPANRSWTEEPRWFGSLSIAKLELREAELVTKEIRVDRFEIEEPRAPGGRR